MSASRSLLVESAKTFVAAWGVVALEPWLQTWLVGWPDLIRFALSAVFCAIALELALLVGIGRPLLRAEWSEVGDPVPLSQIVARVSIGSPETKLFHLKLRLERQTWLGRGILALTLRSEPEFRVTIRNTELVPTVELSSFRDDAPAVVVDQASRSLSIRLSHPPIRAGEWHWANVRWEARVFPELRDSNIDYSLHHRHPLRRLWLWLAIGISTNAKTIRVVRS